MTMTNEIKTTVDEADAVLVAVEDEIDKEMEKYREDESYEEAGVALLLMAKATVAAAQANKIVMEQIAETLDKISDHLDPSI